MSDAEIMVATESYATMDEGAVISVRKDVTRVRADHHFVRENPQNWKPIDVHYESPERATAAPGEKRATKVKAGTAG
jgi:hypothetical protein